MDTGIDTAPALVGGVVARLVERPVYIRKVAGSNATGSTKYGGQVEEVSPACASIGHSLWRRATGRQGFESTRLHLSLNKSD